MLHLKNAFTIQLNSKFESISFQICDIIGGGMVTVMSKDGKPTQVPASVLSTVGSPFPGSWIS